VVGLPAAKSDGRRSVALLYLQGGRWIDIYAFNLQQSFGDQVSVTHSQGPERFVFARLGVSKSYAWAAMFAPGDC
jgi:hypothetical protein